MATYINNTNPERDPDLREGSGTGVIAGILVTALVIILFFVFGLPYIRGTSGLNTPGAPATGGTESNTVVSTSTVNIYDTTIDTGTTSSDSTLIPDLRRE